MGPVAALSVTWALVALTVNDADMPVLASSTVTTWPAV